MVSLYAAADAESPILVANFSPIRRAFFIVTLFQKRSASLISSHKSQVFEFQPVRM